MCLGYLWFEDVLLMGRPKQEHHFGVIDHDIKGTVVTSLYHICTSYALPTQVKVNHDQHCTAINKHQLVPKPLKTMTHL